MQRTAIGGQTETWAALELLYGNVLQRSNLRPGVQPVVVLITDGASQQSERTAREAAKAHSMVRGLLQETMQLIHLLLLMIVYMHFKAVAFFIFTGVYFLLKCIRED